MRRKTKRLLKLFVILLLGALICFIGIHYFKNIKEPDNMQEDSQNKDNDTHEDDIKDPLEASLRKETYFVEENLDRYISYAKKYPDKDMAEVVRSINSYIDYDFYNHDLAAKVDDGLLILCNKFHKLPEGYEAEDLVVMESQYTARANSKMNRTAYEHLKDMIDDAQEEGIKLYNVSSYRTHEYQTTLYNNYVKQSGREYADTTSARPGYSEHETGLATDLNTADSAAHFEKTAQYSWLSQNAYKYGFIERYPEGKEYLTGYEYEPWHYRYVGEEVAKYIHEHNITYDEYYEYFIAHK